VPELVAKNKLKAAALILLGLSISSFYVFHSYSMWEKATALSSDGSTSLSAYAKASEWLSETLKSSETALVPMREIFVALNPELRDRLIDYQSLWSSSGVVLEADTTAQEVLKVRDYFISFVKEDFQLKYVLRDWVDPYARRLYEAISNDELMFLLHEVDTIPFTISTGWGSQVTIYERIPFSALFGMKLSSRPEQSFRSPSDTLIEFTSDGAVVHKEVEDVRFYIPLQAAINASIQLNYFRMRIQPNVEDLTLTVVFYYDADRDGRYVLNTTEHLSPDYTKAVVFSGTQLGWGLEEWYYIAQIIPNSYDPIVQIAFIMNGDKNGTITLADLIVYTETTSGTVVADASKWLSENLKENEIALVPSIGLFYLANSSLRGKLVDYYTLWDSSEIMLRANTTREEILEVRSYFIDFLKTDTHVRYVVRDWIYPYAERLYDVAAGDELELQFHKVQEIPFKIGVGWSRIITIYERLQYTPVLNMYFTSAPKQYFTSPSNATVSFGANGATIQKTDTRVAFYLPLETGIDASKQAYLTAKFELDVENVSLMLGFYYDVNGDGVWSGYDVDNYIGIRLNQTQQGWIKGQWYHLVQVIPTATNPIVQVALIAEEGTTGAIMLANLTVYTQ
jgi:hypothetical protein